MANVYDFSAKTLNGDELPLDSFRGKVLLVVNTASMCGFTPQYKDLEALQEHYAGRGFSVLGFPCNQFGSQEPGNADQIGQFCSTKPWPDLASAGTVFMWTAPLAAAAIQGRSSNA